jgi:hypothetical protein
MNNNAILTLLTYINKIFICLINIFYCNCLSSRLDDLDVGLFI